MIWLTPLEAAGFLRVSRMTIYRYIEQGKLPAYRVSEKKQRIKIDDLDELAGTPGLVARCRVLADLLDAAAGQALQRKDYATAAELPRAAEQVRQLATKRDYWHERLVRLYGVIGDDPALQVCRDLIDGMLDMAVAPL